ncbi:MAG: HDOD domain-containing protein [Planctomycetia bacterium]|nr:HDOD domain-containing protein [Planctomycetia bacterium]
MQETIGNFTIEAFPPNISFPALPSAVTQIMERSRDPKAKLEDLAKIIETDTGLTLELLRRVNSASLGLRVRAGSVRLGLEALGLRDSRNLMLTVGAKAATQARHSRLINPACFWNAALQKALFARELAVLLNTDSDAAYAGALLQDFLLPVVTNELCGRYVEFIERRDQQPITICDFERAEFGWDHALAGACLAFAWNLPGDLVCCILFHHAGLDILNDSRLGQSPVAAVALSALLPDQLRQCYNGLEQLRQLEQRWPAFNLKSVAETVDSKQAEAGLGIPNDFPLARRCKSVFTPGRKRNFEQQPLD